MHGERCSKTSFWVYARLVHARASESQALERVRGRVGKTIDDCVLMGLGAT